MFNGITLGYDAIRTNIDKLPKLSQVAGYDTGSGDVPWTPADFAGFRNPLHICQLAGLDNPDTSDYIDVERFAATNAEAVEWYPRALASYRSAKRPGQRHPAVYTSADNVASLLTAFRSAGIGSGPGLVVANWNLTETQAELDVIDNAGDNFPIVGVQFASGQFYDVDVFEKSWLEAMSEKVPALFWHVTKAGDTFAKVAESRDANLNNLIKRTVDNSTDENLLDIGNAVLVPGTEYATVNP
jgi:hypothetical protein